LAFRDEDYPALREAFGAWRAGDQPRAIAMCLAAVGVERVTNASQGTVATWTFRQDSAVITVSYDRAAKLINIEAPVVEIRPESEVALLRAALSIGRSLGDARFCRRQHTLMITAGGPVDAFPPPRVVEVIRAVAIYADRWDNVFAVEFGGRMVGPLMTTPRGFDMSHLGKPVTLAIDVQAAASSMLPVAHAPSDELVIELLRGAEQLMKVLGFSPIPDGVEVFVHIGFAARATLLSPQSAATRALQAAAAPMQTGAALPAGMRPVYSRVLADRGQGAPAVAPALAAVGDVRMRLARWLLLVDSIKTTAVQLALLLGGLAEIAALGAVDDTTRTRLRGLYESFATTSPTDRQRMSELRQILGKMA
jgi:hypothetical protein